MANTPTASQRQRKLTETAIKKLEHITGKMTMEHIAATVAPKAVNWSDCAGSARVNELLDEIMEFLGIKMK